MKNKKRIYAIFGVLMILSVTVLCALPVYAEDCIVGEDGNVVHDYSEYTYISNGGGYHYKQWYCSRCGDYLDPAYEEWSPCTVDELTNYCTQCGWYSVEECAHEFEYKYLEYNDFYHDAIYECIHCPEVNAEYRNRHQFDGDNECIYCSYVEYDYKGHYVAWLCNGSRLPYEARW